MGRTVATAAGDAELLEASRRGERAAFGRLVERYQSLVCAVSYGATGDRALSEDVAQETFLVAWRGLDDLREPASLRAWLCGIARNLGRKAHRRRGRETPAEGEPVAQAESPFEQTASAESERIVWDALRRLPETYREALILYYREGQSVRDVATALGISENAALQRLSRGRKLLAEHVSQVVESSLASTRPRHGFAAGVMAALPDRSSPHVTHTQHGETTMLKIALIAGAVAAATTTAVVVHQRAGADTSTAERAWVDAPPTLEAAGTAAAVAPAAPRTAERPQLQAPMKVVSHAPEPDTEPRVDADDIARLSLYAGPSRGPADAPVTVVVFGDFMCKFCARVLGTVDELWDEYPGQLRLVIKQMPVHEEARLAAQAALAAEEQGKFWELHDLMYANQEDLSRDAVLGYAAQAGLDVDRLRRDLDRGAYADALAQDMATASELEIRGTPSFLINGKRFVGARPIDQFRQSIDAELTRAGIAPPRHPHGSSVAASADEECADQP